MSPTQDEEAAARRQRWLANRRTGLGATDAYAVLGLCPWGKTPLHVYADKLDLLPERDNPSMKIGRHLEDAVANLYRDETGRVPLVPGGGEEGLYRHPAAPWLFCSPDRFFVDPVNPNAFLPLEIKTSTRWDDWGPSGGREIPAHYMIQVQHQMLCLGATRADVAVLICGQDLRVYTIPACKELQDDIFERCTRFWDDHVLTRTPPPPDWLAPGTLELLATLTRPTVQDVLELDSPEAQHWADRYREGRRLVNMGEAAVAEARDNLILLMGEHANAILPDRRRLVRSEINVREHTVKAHSYVGFRMVVPRRQQPTTAADNHPDTGEEFS